jgi:hypothetical protein
MTARAHTDGGPNDDLTAVLELDVDVAVGETGRSARRRWSMESTGSGTDFSQYAGGLNGSVRRRVELSRGQGGARFVRRTN